MSAISQHFEISIHAPPRGATSTTAPVARRLGHFNSRPSARGDETFKCLRFRREDFNSRPSARGDAITMRTFRVC